VGAVEDFEIIANIKPGAGRLALARAPPDSLVTSKAH